MNILSEIFNRNDIKVFQSSLREDFIFVYSITQHLIEKYIEYVSFELDLNIVYAIRNNSDIQKYLLSCEIFDKLKNCFSLVSMEYSLNQFGFVRTHTVQSMGQWSVKGDIVHLWPIGYTNPIRVSYFGDEIEYIQIYDQIYNTKIAELERVYIGDMEKIPEQVDRDAVIIQNDKKNYCQSFCLFSQFDPKFGNIVDEDYQKIEFDFTYPQLYFKRFDILEKDIENKLKFDWKIYISTNYKEQLPQNLLKFCFQEEIGARRLEAGFLSTKRKILYLTDRELFGTIFLDSNTKKIRTKQAKKILERLEGEIDIDDFVVHEDHGIGIYKGLTQEKIIEDEIVNFETKKIEKLENYMLISYAEGDELYVPLTQLHKITKYIGATDVKPEVTRLHKGMWKNLIAKTKKAVVLVAKDLVQHFAKLSLATTSAIDYEDSQDYRKFVDSFMFDETEDQITTENDIKKDLAQEKPMDRLIVGDVGFGKTEIAMRACFKVIESFKQVVVLCPTTVLTAQHYKVFRDRFAKFGVKIAYVSRFNTPKDNSKIILEANEGKVDILIGTHRLLSNDLNMKDLGLIIIDEEQKFGVKQKEKIRRLQYTAHSLSMSATPIPRTLSMALSEIKDISIIVTPPKERLGVKTEVSLLDWNTISFQIRQELARGGQVYFLHNRVETIESIKKRLEQVIPSVRIAIAHGQMRPQILDRVISDFYEKKYDVLLCTTIIENGIDMPNVNTMIINDGQNFGLGQLYQLRGRVGRSKRQGFCYIYYKGRDLEHKTSNIEHENKELGLEQKVKKPKKYIDRLKAILENQELGSGFRLASRDLEIRGAGNLLGESQHGHIAKVGLALYMQMLAEEIERIKQLSVNGKE